MEKTLDTIAVVQFCGLIIESLGIIILRETKQWLQLPLTCLVTVDLETICRYLIIYDEYIYMYVYIYVFYTNCLCFDLPVWLKFTFLWSDLPILQTPECVSQYQPLTWQMCFHSWMFQHFYSTLPCSNIHAQNASTWPTWPNSSDFGPGAV